MKLIVILVICVLGCIVHADEVCYEDLGCFTDELECHRDNFPPQTPAEINTHFYLYTRRNRFAPYELIRNDVDNIRNSLFDPTKKTKILSHGYLGDISGLIWGQFKDGFLDWGDVNFILMDWGDGSFGPYPLAMQNARVVARQLVSLIKSLNLEKGAYFKDVHVLGYSLGGHMAGYAGQDISGLGRITGLDAAGPGFEDTDIPECRLDKSDALLVDAIHTDGTPAGSGTLNPYGHMDFYPNGGLNQPGCTLDRLTSCSHGRPRDYFLESLTSTDCQFTSYPCSSWTSYRLGQCNSCDGQGCPVMGIDAELNPREGAFYLDTNGESPFCIN